MKKLVLLTGLVCGVFFLGPVDSASAGRGHGGGYGGGYGHGGGHHHGHDHWGHGGGYGHGGYGRGYGYGGGYGGGYNRRIIPLNGHLHWHGDHYDYHPTPHYYNRPRGYIGVYGW